MKSVSIFVVVQVLGKGNMVIEFFALIARLTSEDRQQKTIGASADSKGTGKRG